MTNSGLSFGFPEKAWGLDSPNQKLMNLLVDSIGTISTSLVPKKNVEETRVCPFLGDFLLVSLKKKESHTQSEHAVLEGQGKPPKPPKTNMMKRTLVFNGPFSPWFKGKPIGKKHNFSGPSLTHLSFHVSCHEDACVLRVVACGGGGWEWC